jgi:ribonuclease Y
MSEFSFILIIITLLVGLGIIFWSKTNIVNQKIQQAKDSAGRIIDDARRDADALLKEASIEAKDRLLKLKSEFDAETKETRSELKKREARLIQKEENIDHKIDQHEKKEHELFNKEKELDLRTGEILKKEQKYNELIGEQKSQLERISTLTADQAKELLLRAMENEARYEGAKLIKRIENESIEVANKKAKKI